MLAVCPGCPGSTPSTAVRISPSFYLLLWTHCFPFIFTRLQLMPFYPATPSFSVSWAACSCYKQSYIHTESTAFSLDFQLVGITVAVHNNPPHAFVSQSGDHSCLMLLGLLLASRHRDRVNPGETWYGECESCSQPGGRTLCSNLSRTQAVGC